jgi:hypothetical protein
VNAQPSSEEANAPPSPTGREDLADDLCPICTLIHLAGAMVPTDKPPLPLPTILGELRNTEVRVFSMPSVKAPGVKVSRRQAYFCGCVTGAPARGCSDRVREFARACLHLIEQPHVLDRDHGVVGEGGRQFNLFGAKWTRHASCQEYHPYDISLA